VFRLAYVYYSDSQLASILLLVVLMFCLLVGD